MPDIADDNWSERDDRNSELAPNGWPPGLPAYIEKIGQMMMGALKRSYNRYNPIYQTTGSGDNYVVTTEGQQTAINLFEIIRTRVDRSNTTTTPTFQYANTAPRVIMKYGSAGKIALVIGDMTAGRSHDFWYDGTNWILNNPATVSQADITNALNNLPTSPSGLPVGAWYINGGVLSQVQP